MSNVSVKGDSDYPAVAAQRGIVPETWKALRNVVFAGQGSDSTVALVWDYCKARGLDPLKKPVHIVPVYDSSKRAYVDTIWPGISEIRTTAARTGLYAGKDEVVFGEDVTREFQDEDYDTKKKTTLTVTFPKWAQVTVYRLVNGVRVPFVGDKIYWTEAYASKKSGSPNAMWQKRPYGQLGKCAEAAALRAAFPEELGSVYSAEEMEGKSINENLSVAATPTFSLEKSQEVIDSKTGEVITPKQETAPDEAQDDPHKKELFLSTLKKRAKSAGLPDDDIKRQMAQFLEMDEPDNLEDFTIKQIELFGKYLADMQK
jgi:phage recombination protein Bet